MATQTARRSVVEAPPEWGIEPIPDSHRFLGFVDYFALWSSLGVGLLVLVAGTFLVPGLGLSQALSAIVLGTLIGVLLLALAGVIGSETALPTMVLLRPVLGVRGSLLPTALNVVQLIGWGSFEIFIMAQAANGIGQRVFGVGNAYAGWAVAIAAFCTLLAIGGPLAVVRRWLKKFAIWLVFITSVYLTWYLVTQYDVAALLAAPGNGTLPFWSGVDLVIAMPVSWLPLVADYNRFSSGTRPAFWGTYIGYLVANVWFFALGATFVLALKVQDIVPAILSVAGGWVALLLLVADETDNGFANIYSTAVSLQNAVPRVAQRWLIVGVGVACLGVAIALGSSLAQYEIFLFLIGAFFVPLFGVQAAHYFVVSGRRYDAAGLAADPPRGAVTGIRWTAVGIWLLGFVLYQWIAPTDIAGWKALLGGVFGALRLPFPLDAVATRFGASIPSFLFAFTLYALVGRRARLPRADGSRH
jgi:putative hydroxymethylpyrimidine transporter CytX